MITLLYVSLALTVAVAVPLTWWLRVEGDRSWREHQLREATGPIRRAFVQLRIEITARFTPALQQVAEAASRLFEALGAPTPWSRAVTAELVRLTLGGHPDRPELLITETPTTSATTRTES